MKLHFLGANRQVTGSRYCLQTDHTTLLIDCGMFQEREYLGRNWQTSPIPPDQIDAVVLTHAHVDHCGLIPRLVAEGFQGPVLCTRATASLAEIILRDAAKIQVEDAAYKRKRHQKEGRRSKYPVAPLFDEQDVAQTLPRFQGEPYEKPIDINQHAQLYFHDAGHILGSAMVQLSVCENNAVRRIVFSGDIGQWDKPIVRDPTLIDEADYVVMESTYGDRNHQESGEIGAQLAEVINTAVHEGGKVVIPTFAVERAQELMYYIGSLLHEQRIPAVPVFLDSPMAVDVTETFARHRDAFDHQTWQLIVAGHSPLRFPGLTLVRSVQQSKQINDLKEPAIIMSTSGMCTAGRIKHHLAHTIDEPRNTVLFVGYQAHGTLGRQILEGNSLVRIHGRMRPVRARIAQIHGFSGHADRDGLLRWVTNFQKPPQQLFLTHGEQQSANSLAEHIRQHFGWQVDVPAYQTKVELT
jgi:metallo-beta-lactamase family protein